MNRIRVRAIIEHEGKLLCVRNVSSPEFWCLPGGGVELGEDIQTALIREMIEETGIEPKLGNLIYVHQFKQDGVFGSPEYLFHIVNSNAYLNLDLSATSHGELELAEIKFVEPNSVELLPKFIKSELPAIIAENFSGPSRLRIVTN